MKKLIKKIILFTLIFAVVFALAGCDEQNGNGGGTSIPRNDSREVLKVYNATEYIDKTTIADFEKEFNIRVAYAEFESNEDMYDEIGGKSGEYDVLVPSDYMVDRLIKEGKLAKIDPAKVPNIQFVAPQYLKPDYDPDNDYTVPYMVGTFGILYNKRVVSEPVESWSVLWDTKYRGQILMWDSQRDIIGMTLKMLGFSMNSNDDSELGQAKSRLNSGRTLFQFGSDEIRDKMVADEGALAVVYSGDAKTAVDENPNLRYVIPEEGSNKWVDGFVIMKDTKHMDAAEKFINFMCRPNIAVRNMTRTGYTSPIFGAWSEFGNNKIMFPTEEELARCEAFLYDKDATQKYDRLWSEVR